MLASKPTLRSAPPQLVDDAREELRIQVRFAAGPGTRFFPLEVLLNPFEVKAGLENSSEKLPWD